MIIFLPILGNEDGRILETLPSGENIHGKLHEMLLRYGDFIPANGMAEVVDEQGNENRVYFAKSSPGVWAFTTTPPEQTTLPGV